MKKTVNEQGQDAMLFNTRAYMRRLLETKIRRKDFRWFKKRRSYRRVTGQNMITYLHVTVFLDFEFPISS